jgi:hypothetical protein
MGVLKRRLCGGSGVCISRLPPKCEASTRLRIPICGPSPECLTKASFLIVHYFFGAGGEFCSLLGGTMFFIRM